MDSENNMRQTPEDIDRDEGEMTGAYDEANDFDSRPEPPMRWNGGTSADPFPDSEFDPESRQSTPPLTGVGAVGKTRFELKGDEIAEFSSAQRHVMAAHIIALISLFFGGALLSAAALICAIIAYGKLNRLALGKSGDEDVQRALRRTGKLAIVISVSALILNIMAMVFLYPIVAGSLQGNPMNTIFGTGQMATPGAGNSTWG